MSGLPPNDIPFRNSNGTITQLKSIVYTTHSLASYSFDNREKVEGKFLTSK